MGDSSKCQMQNCSSDANPISKISGVVLNDCQCGTENNICPRDSACSGAVVTSSRMAHCYNVCGSGAATEDSC